MNSAETREAASSYCFHRQPYSLLSGRISRPRAHKEIKSGKEIKKGVERKKRAAEKKIPGNRQLDFLKGAEGEGYVVPCGP